MTRKECLEQAAKCILQNRQDQYGDVEDCFKKIARLWNAYLPSVVELEPYDVACMMALLKIARIQANPKHGDSWVDLAGYAACGADIAVPEPFRYDKPKAEGGCCQNGKDYAIPEFKPGDAVEWNSIGKSWCPAVYLREFGDFGHCVVRLPDGRERIVSKADLRKTESNHPENPDSSPEFKPGDMVLATMPEGEDVRCVYVGESKNPGCCCVRYLGGDFSGDTDDTVPIDQLRRVPVSKAEGCEELVRDKEESDVERVFGTLKKRPAPEFDAPQTAQELYRRIIANNPATFEGHTPTGEELAEMAEEEKRG